MGGEIYGRNGEKESIFYWTLWCMDLLFYGGLYASSIETFKRDWLKDDCNNCSDTVADV